MSITNKISSPRWGRCERTERKGKWTSIINREDQAAKEEEEDEENMFLSFLSFSVWLYSKVAICTQQNTTMRK